jgi:hypothetical protein
METRKKAKLDLQAVKWGGNMDRLPGCKSRLDLLGH